MPPQWYRAADRLEALQWTGHNQNEMEAFDPRLVYDEARELWRIPLVGNVYKDIPLDWWVTRNQANALDAVDPVRFDNSFLRDVAPPT